MSTSVPASVVTKTGEYSVQRNGTSLKWDDILEKYVAGTPFAYTTRESRAAQQRYYYKSSTSTPNFRNIIKSGGMLPSNAFSHVSSVRTHKNGTYFVEQWSKHVMVDRISITGYWGPDDELYIHSIPGPSSNQWSALDREARTKVRLALKQQTVNLAQIYAERDKTIASVSKIIRTVAEMILALKAGNLKRAGEVAGKHVGWKARRAHGQSRKADPANALANAWLEFQYAVIPLMLDAQGLAESLAKYNTRPIVGRVSSTHTLTGHDDTTTGNLFSGIIRSQSQWKVSRRYVVFYKVDAPQLPDFAGMGLTNPLQLGWELIPFSFVVDWFLQIGDWLSSFDATVGLTFASGSVSTKVDSQMTKTLTRERRYTGSDSKYVQLESFKTSVVNDEVYREPIYVFPAVSVIPAFKNPLSLKHIITSMALLKKVL